MSLLNEMLHDLAKKNTSNQNRPLLTAALSHSEQKKRMPYLVGGISILMLLLIGIVFKTHVTVKPLQVANKHKEVVPATVKAVVVAPPTPAKHPKSLAAHPLQKAPDLKQKWAKNTVKAPSKKPSIPTHVVTKLQGILVKAPDDIKAREQLAFLFLSHGHFSNAMKVLDEGLEYAPDNASLITMKAKIFIAQDQLKSAIHLLKSDHPSIVSHPEYYATLATALASQGQMAQAGTYYKALIKVDPNNGKYWLGYGIALEHANQTGQAIDAYKRASQTIGTEIAVRKEAKERLNTLVG
jgi:MSHA biogenesis protein MshN